MIGLTARRRSISTLPSLYQRIKQTENEIVKMFLVHNPAPDSSISSSGKKKLFSNVGREIY